MSRRVRAAAVLLVCLAQGSCARPSQVQLSGATPPPRTPPSSSDAASPQISIYPVPHHAPGSPDLAPSATPSPDALPDIAGTPCGNESEVTDHHVRVLTRTKCYEASGTTPQELQVSVAEEGPRADGRVAAAVTHWRLRWSYTLVSGDATCEVERPDVQAVIVYVLPAWMPPAGTSDSTIEYWRNFSAAVQAHEARHGAIAVDGGVAARKSLLDLPPGVACPRVSDVADTRVKAVISRHEVKQRAFDAAAGG